MKTSTRIWQTAKALGALPIAAWKSVFTSTSLHMSEWFQGLSASWVTTTYENLAKKAHRNPYAARSLRVISQNLASIPLVVLKDGDPTTDQSLVDLLKRPNPRQTFRHFVDTIVNHLYCGGELFLERRGPTTGPNKGKTKQLFLHKPSLFLEFIKNDTRMPIGFLGRLEPETLRLVGEGDIIGYWMSNGRGKRTAYTIDQMAHIRVYNPTDEDRGLPILIGAYRAIQTMEASADWNKSIATGGGRVPGFWKPEGLEPGDQLTTEQVDSAQTSLDERIKERQKSNLPLVMSGSYAWQDGSISPKDADWLEGDKHSGRMVGAVTGVSPLLLGDVRAGSLTDAGLNSELRALLLLTVLPLLDFILEELNIWLTPAFGKGIELGYDKDQIEVLHADLTDKYNRYFRACGGPFISRDDAREALNHKPKGGVFDDILEPIGTRLAGEGPTGGMPDDVNKVIRLVMGETG